MAIHLSDNALKGLSKAGNKAAEAELVDRDRLFTEWLTAQQKIMLWATSPGDQDLIVAENHKLVQQGMTPYEATLHIAQFIREILNPARHSHDS